MSHSETSAEALCSHPFPSSLLLPKSPSFTPASLLPQHPHWWCWHAHLGCEQISHWPFFCPGAYHRVKCWAGDSKDMLVLCISTFTSIKQSPGKKEDKNGTLVLKMDGDNSWGSWRNTKGYLGRGPEVGGLGFCLHLQIPGTPTLRFDFLETLLLLWTPSITLSHRNPDEDKGNRARESLISWGLKVEQVWWVPWAQEGNLLLLDPEVDTQKVCSHKHVAINSWIFLQRKCIMC